MPAMLVVGVLLDISCWKFRKMTMILLTYECVMLVLNGCLPVDKGVDGPFQNFASLLILQVFLGCHAAVTIIFSTLLFFLIEFL